MRCASDSAAPKNAMSATHRQIRDQWRHARRIRKCIADLFGCVREHVGATPDDRHLRAASREMACCRKTDAGTAAADYDYLTHVHAPC
ncbi:hypothetical protein WL67_17925 [Burkholderia ubonensis]|nr:hypothetical protein WL66_19720 [Burkholderia ubonensis]KWD51725.1 hypothetical protein WL67_17925 [Burkholderia ubonensis]